MRFNQLPQLVHVRIGSYLLYEDVCSLVCSTKSVTAYSCELLWQHLVSVYDIPEGFNSISPSSKKCFQAALKYFDMFCTPNIRKIIDKSWNIEVMIRLRERTNKHSTDAITTLPNNCIAVYDERTDSPALFRFHKVFNPNCSQKEVFDETGNKAIQDVLDGENTTMFMYGPTGSGKTHTMIGPSHVSHINEWNSTDFGIVPRCLSRLFDQLNLRVSSGILSSFVVQMSAIEVYLSKGYNLLDHTTNTRNYTMQRSLVKLSLVKMPNSHNCFQFDSSTQETVSSLSEAMKLLSRAIRNRQTFSNKVNQSSSRSHMILQFKVIQVAKLNGVGELEHSTLGIYNKGREMVGLTPSSTSITASASARNISGTLNFIDLAGSEWVSKTEATGERLQEAKSINLSLSCLVRCIHALALKLPHIPFRDCLLTRVLSSALSGDCKTVMMITCSVDEDDRVASLAAIKFGQYAVLVKIQTHQEINFEDETAMKISKLKSKLRSLRTILRQIARDRRLTKLKLGMLGLRDNDNDNVVFFQDDEDENENGPEMRNPLYCKYLDELRQLVELKELEGDSARSTNTTTSSSRWSRINDDDDNNSDSSNDSNKDLRRMVYAHDSDNDDENDYERQVERGERRSITDENDEDLQEL